MGWALERSSENIGGERRRWLDGAYRQRVLKHVARIPARLHAPQTLVIVFVIQCVPGHARSIQCGVREVGVGVIYKRAIVHIVGRRNATGLGEKLSIKAT